MDLQAPVAITSVTDNADTVVQKFFSIAGNTDPAITAIRNNILQQQSQKPFVEKFVNYAGYPVWDKAVIKNFAENTTSNSITQRGGDHFKMVFIPLAADNDSVIKAILKVKINGSDTSFKVLYRWQYNQYGYGKVKQHNNADQTALLFMGFENYVFGHKDFKINDTLLFNKKKKRITPDTITITSFNNYGVANRMVEVSITVCYDERIPDATARISSSNIVPCHCHIEEVCNEYSVWVDGGGGSGGGGSDGGTSPLPPGGGGSNNGGNWNDDPCAPNSPALPRVDNLAPPICDDGGGDDDPWVPVPIEDDYYEFNKSIFDTNTGDLDNNSIGNFDLTSYTIYQVSQTWPTIGNVIPVSDFIGWGTPGIDKNCMSYAKAQIAKKGYKISNYNTPGQTIQVYTESGGANADAVKDAIGYLISALQRGIPVIVGIDDIDGSSNPQTDNTTDHFVVIVGMGTDSKGNYFSFYDNASGDPSQGTNPDNKLYFDSSTWLIKGKSQTYYGSQVRDYIVTMIRKSK